MKKALLYCTLYAIIIYLTSGTLNPALAATQPSGGSATHVYGVIDDQWDKQHSDQYLNRRYARTTAANLDVGEPRTVRLVYFLPNDRPYHAEVVERLKEEILDIQTFYSEAMQAHGYRDMTFQIESDEQGEPVVHRVDGQKSEIYYVDDTSSTVRAEIGQVFDVTQNIYFIVVDSSIDGIGTGVGNGRVGANAARRGKNGGDVLIPVHHFRNRIKDNEPGYDNRSRVWTTTRFS